MQKQSRAYDVKAHAEKMKKSQLSCCTFLKSDMSPLVNGARQQMAARSLPHLENSHNASSGGNFFPYPYGESEDSGRCGPCTS